MGEHAVLAKGDGDTEDKGLEQMFERAEDREQGIQRRQHYHGSVVEGRCRGSRCGQACNQTGNGRTGPQQQRFSQNCGNYVGDLKKMARVEKSF